MAGVDATLLVVTVRWEKFTRGLCNPLHRLLGVIQKVKTTFLQAYEPPRDRLPKMEGVLFVICFLIFLTS